MPGNMGIPLLLISTLELFMLLSKKLIKELEILKARKTKFIWITVIVIFKGEELASLLLELVSYPSEQSTKYVQNKTKIPVI